MLLFFALLRQVQIQAINNCRGRIMRRKMAERLQCSETQQRAQNPCFKYPWLAVSIERRSPCFALAHMSLLKPEWWQSRTCMQCACKYLGRFEGGGKGMCAPASLLDLKDKGCQPSTFPQKKGQEKKSNAFRESLRGEHEESKMFCTF